MFAVMRSLPRDFLFSSSYQITPWSVDMSDPTDCTPCSHNGPYVCQTHNTTRWQVKQSELMTCWLPWVVTHVKAASDKIRLYGLFERRRGHFAIWRKAIRRSRWQRDGSVVYDEASGESRGRPESCLTKSLMNVSVSDQKTCFNY